MGSRSAESGHGSGPPSWSGWSPRWPPCCCRCWSSNRRRLSLSRAGATSALRTRLPSARRCHAVGRAARRSRPVRNRSSCTVCVLPWRAWLPVATKNTSAPSISVKWGPSTSTLISRSTATVTGPTATTSSRPPVPYFKMTEATAATVDDLADHYRRNNAAAVVFTIDAETGMGHPPNSVEDLIAGAARNNDVLIPFGTVDPWMAAARWPGSANWWTSTACGVQVSPEHAGLRTQRPPVLPDLRGDRGGGCAGAVPHRPDRHRFGSAGWARYQAALLGPDDARRRRRGFSRPDDRHGASRRAVGGRADRHRTTQVQRVHRPVRLFAEVLSAATGPRDGPATAHQSAVRHRPPVHSYRPLAPGLR